MLNITYTLDCFGISDIGLVREHNEDVWDAFPEEGFFLVADGMGGHLAGEIAAKQSVEFLSRKFKERYSKSNISLEEAKSFFQNALIETNRWVYKKAKTDEDLSGMGTTLSALFFLHDAAVLAHVGDSRIYRLRNAKLQRMTEDHTLVSEMISLGAMRPEEGKLFPYKHILTKAIGTQLSVEPEINYCDVKPLDLFMLCTDGLTNFVEEDEIEEVLSRSLSMKEKGHELVRLANGHGGGDNITLVLVGIGNDLPG